MSESVEDLGQQSYLENDVHTQIMIYFRRKLIIDFCSPMYFSEVVCGILLYDPYVYYFYAIFIQ